MVVMMVEEVKEKGGPKECDEHKERNQGQVSPTPAVYATVLHTCTVACTSDPH